MKKGFLLALLVVTVVALAAPAVARAPIVNPLPDIVIGDVGDEDAGTGQRLLRYLDITNVGAESWIQTQNGMGTTNLSVYYASFSSTVNPDDSVIVKASTNAAIVEPLTDVQRTILTGSLIPPAGETKKINAGGFGYLSLINTMVTQGTFTSAYSATPALNGLTVANYPAGYDAVSTLTIYAFERAFDGAATVPLLGQASSLVWSVTGSPDRLGSSTSLASLNFAGTANGWVPGAPAPTPDYGVVGAFHNGLGLAFDAPADNTGVIYGLWSSGTGGTTVAPFISADEASVGENRVIHMAVTLGATAATAAACPGYRLLYASDAFTHVGGMLAFTAAASGPSYAPATGAPFVAHLYWEVPYGLTEYKDGELLSDFSAINPSFADARDYKLQWELVDSEATDAGEIWLAAIQAEAVQRPLGDVPFIAWGGTGVPFDDATQGFQESLKQVTINGVLWGRGNVDYGPGATYLDIGAGGGAQGYQEVAPRPYGAGVAPSWTADKLVRYRSAWASASSVNATPQVRILTLIWRGTAAAPAVANLVWVDEFGGDTAKIFMQLAGQTTGEAPGVAKTSGSVLSTYYWTHGGGGTGAGRIAPTVDVYNAGNFNGTTWPNTSGQLRLSSFSVEDGI